MTLSVADKTALELLKRQIEHGIVDDGVPKLRLKGLPDGSYEASLPGVMSRQGRSPSEALKNLQGSMRDYKVRLEDGGIAHGVLGEEQLWILQSYFGRPSCSCGFTPDGHCYCFE